MLFLTNDVRHAPEEFVRKLWRLGFQASLSEVVTVGAAVQYLLAGRGGGAGVRGRLAGARRPRRRGRAADRQPHASSPRAPTSSWSAPTTASTYDELRIAAQAVMRGAELIGATRDASFPMPDGPWPGTGAVLAAIEPAAGRTADRVVGKPEPPMYEAARDRLGDGPLLAVGDRLEIDVAGRAPRGPGLRARPHRRHDARAGRRRRPEVPRTSRTRSRRWCCE